MGYDKERVLVLEPKEGYDRVSKIYNKYHKYLDERDNGLFQKFLPKDLVGLKILDIGGGDGRISKFFASKNVGEYTLADISLSMLKRAKNWINKVQMDIEEVFPFEDNYFDISLCYFVLLHINDVEHFFAESYRTLKPGGKLILLHHMERRPFEYTLQRQPFKIKTYNHRYELVEKFAKNSFFDINYIDLKIKDDIIGKLYVFTKD